LARARLSSFRLSSVPGLWSSCANVSRGRFAPRDASPSRCRGSAVPARRTSSPRAFGAAVGSAPRTPRTIFIGAHPAGACDPYRALTPAHRCCRYAPTQLGNGQKPGCAPRSRAGNRFAPLVPWTVTTNVIPRVIARCAADRKRRNGAPLRYAVPSHNAGVAGSSPAPAISFRCDLAAMIAVTVRSRVERRPLRGRGSPAVRVPPLLLDFGATPRRRSQRR
jgi:hypothetical protein